MKRWISLLLVAAMLMSLAVTTLAAPTTEASGEDTGLSDVIGDVSGGSGQEEAGPTETDTPEGISPIGELDDDPFASPVMPAAETDPTDVEGATVWRAMVYYVGQGDLYHVERSADFQIKYQLEFNTDEDLEAGAVELRMPASLLTDRSGNPVMPESVGVPYGTKTSPVASKTSSFNYYTETVGSETYLVFFNYEKIIAGKNATIQVLYPLERAFDVKDMTQWSLTPDAKVVVRVPDAASDTGYKEERQHMQLRPLTGVVDTQAKVTSASKTAVTGKAYEPMLYTYKQVSKYLDIPESQLDFDTYAYAVWQVSADVTYNQPWEIYFDENSFFVIDPKNSPNAQNPGEVVGVSGMTRKATTINTKGTTTPVSGGTYDGKYFVGETRTLDKAKNGTVTERVYWYVVTAYPKASLVPNETSFHNEVNVILHPLDGLDADSNAKAADSCTFKTFKWNHPDGIIDFYKYSDHSKNSWTAVYKALSAQGEDYGGINFRNDGILLGYANTHDCPQYVKEPEGGDPYVYTYNYIPGKYDEMITVDDFLHAMVDHVEAGGDKTIEGQHVRLTKEDYYFSAVTVTMVEREYDFYENKTLDAATPAAEALDKSGNPIDRTLRVYAMFADKAGNGDTEAEWEYVGETPWNDSGTLVYTFTADQIARGPYRVKAVGNTIDDTRCYIDVEITIRHDSPVFQDWIKNGADTIQLWNIGGIQGRTEAGEWFHDRVQLDIGNYVEEQKAGLQLIEFTDRLYGNSNNKELAIDDDDGDGSLLMRDAAGAALLPISKDAAAAKSASVKNDPVNGQYKVTYTLTGYESYLLNSREDVTVLEAAGLDEPSNRKDVVFYDLLPKNVQFDPTVPVTASLTSGTKSQVTVTVDEKTDIIKNWNNTGRTLVQFHVSYSGADPSVISDVKGGDSVQWKTGYQVRFGAYCSWSDAAVALDEENIVAYMPAKDDNTPLVGTMEQVACDDGNRPNGTQLDGLYAPFAKGDLDGDGVKDVRNVLYANADATANGAIATETGITKEIKADDDPVTPWGTSIKVNPGRNYTYRITVNNASAVYPMTDLVIYDRLENAAKDRCTEEPWSTFDADYWHGEFLGLDLSYAESLGIQPVVYFNENRDAVLPSFSAPETPESCLTTTNGWYEASVFLQNHDASDVKAFAVDLRTSENGDFALSADTVDAVSIEVHMKGVFTEQTDGGVWAYNNPAYTSQQNGLLKTREGNSVRVRMEQNGSFIVEKHVTNAPNSMKNVSFNFQLKLAGTDDYYAYQTYTLQDLVNGDWVSQTGRIYSTDAQGKLQLKDNQRAVFSNAENLTVEELGTGIIWKSAKTTTTEKLNDKDTQVTNVFTNEWVPLLYLEKEIKGFAVEPQNKTFTFMVETSEDGLNWTPLANAPYWVVKENFAGTTLNPPVVSEGVTKADGTLTLTAGEIAAVAPGHSGIRYRVTEQTASTPDWICKSDTETGTLGNLGSTEKFTNYYKYKELRITKNLTHQDPADCTQAFTFTLYTVGDDGTLTPVSEALNWSLEDGSAAGTLKNGSFTVACAGKTVVVSGLTAGQKYCIKETDTGDNYAAEKAGGVTFTVYPESSGKNVTVTNDYLLRDLSVTKQVVGKGSVSKAFTMTLEKKDAAGVWQPVANQGYTYAGPYSGGSDTTGADGTFTLSAGFTATFKNLDKEGAEYRVTETYDSDYPQISPASSGGICDPLYLTLTDNGAAGTITNGVPGMVMVRKAWTAADSVAEEYLNFTSLSNLSWSVTVEVDKGNGWESAADIPYYIVYPYYTNGPITNSTGIQTNLGSNATVVLDLSAPGQETWKYRVTETDAYGSSQKQYSYYGRDGKTGYFQSTALVDQVTGTVKDDSLAVVKNAISGQQVVTYSKKMLGGTPDIGAELVYRVERYNGAEWEPAFGVPYLVAYGSPYNPPEQENATAQDGLITMTYNGAMPYVSFTDEIHLNYPVGKVGDLRLVEVAERTDPSWGSLVGYTGRDGSTGIYKDTANITGFVNGTGFTTLQVKKLMDDGTTGAGPFTFQLTQVIGQTGTAVGSGVGYTVYNVGEDTPLSTGVTDEKGQFTLLSGQYAILDVPEKTQWKVKELVTMPYELADTQVNGDQVTPDAGDASAGNVDLRSSMMLIPGKQLNALMSNPYAASITFGLKSDYPGISAQTGTPVDVNGSGSVMLYQTKVDSYRSSYYILGDDQIIANYDCSEMFRGLGYGGLTGIYGLERIDTSQVTNMSYMFNAIGNQNLTDLDLSGLDTSQVTDMSYMLGSNSQITYMDLSGWDTSQVKNMSYMFSGNNGLTTVDVSGWDTGSVTDMNHMFNYCNKLTTVDVSKWDTSQVKDMSYMFYNCNTLTTLDVSNWNTSQVKDMSYMFYVCRILRTPDVSKWDTSNVESMAGMFQGSGVSTPDVRNWNTGKVKSMASMFLESSLISLDVSEWDTGSVESMRYMFKSCVNLTALDVSKWDTRNVTDMSDMFNGCSRSLATLDVSKWDTGSVTSMFGMFRDCSKLTTLDVSGWNTGSVTNMNYMFKGCSKLTSLDLSSWNTAKVTSMGNMFNQCTALTTIYASDDLFVTGQVESSTSMFGSCSKLQGGAGTKYNSGKTDKTYARIDGGATKPGYFTAK